MFLKVYSVVGYVDIIIIGKSIWLRVAVVVRIKGLESNFFIFFKEWIWFYYVKKRMFILGKWNEISLFLVSLCRLFEY